MNGWFDAGPLEAIPEPGALGFEQGDLAFFVVRKAGEVYAYRNRCPHTGAPLEWQPHQFLDFDGGFIQCAIHGALFRVRDGYCVRGPCATQSLQAMPVTVRKGRVWVELGI